MARTKARRTAARPARAQASEHRRVGYALVGAGHIAQAAVLPAFQHAVENSRLAAIVSGDAAKRAELAQRYPGVRTYAYEQLDDCLQSGDVEAVYLATPNTQHGELTERAARAGVHVLCEKPMATSEDECRRMIRACEESGVQLMIAYRLHFEPVNLRAVDLAQSGRLGELRYLSSVFSYQVAQHDIRVSPELGGGPLWDIGIYCINAARYLFRAEPEEVSAFSAGVAIDPRFDGLPATVAALLRFPGERLAQFTCSFGAAQAESLHLVGSEGDLRIDDVYSYSARRQLELHAPDRSLRKTYPPTDQFGPELLAFSQAILEGRPVEPNGWEGLADVRVIAALIDSLRARRPIALEPYERFARPAPDQEIVRPAIQPPSLVHAGPPHT